MVLSKYQLFLVKESTNPKIFYEIRGFTSFSIDKNTPISSNPVPESDSKDTILVKLEGNTTNISLDWVLLENANGYIGTGITYNGGQQKWEVSGTLTEFNTVLDQVNLLDMYMSTTSIGDLFSLRLYDGLIGTRPIWSKQGLPSQFGIRASSSSPVNWSASMQFIEGLVVAGSDLNTPEAPTITSVSTMGGNIGFTVNFKESSTITGTSRPIVAGGQLIYKKTNSPQQYLELNLAFSQSTVAPYAYTKNFQLPTGTLSAGTYDLQLVLLTDGSFTGNFDQYKGIYSKVWKHTVV